MSSSSDHSYSSNDSGATASEPPLKTIWEDLLESRGVQWDKKYLTDDETLTQEEMSTLLTIIGAGKVDEISKKVCNIPALSLSIEKHFLEEINRQATILMSRTVQQSCLFKFRGLEELVNVEMLFEEIVNEMDTRYSKAVHP